MWFVGGKGEWRVDNGLGVVIGDAERSPSRRNPRRGMNFKRWGKCGIGGFVAERWGEVKVENGVWGSEW